MNWTEYEKEQARIALSMRICQIETGTNTMRAVDAHNYNKTLTHSERRKHHSINVNQLTSEQREVVQTMERMIRDLQNNF